MAAHGDERRRPDGDGVGAEGHGPHHVAGVAQGARGHEAHRGADALLAQPLVHGGQGQLDGDAHVVADALGRRARAAAEAVQHDDVGAGPGHAGGDGGHVVHGGHLHGHGLGVAGGLLQREDELAQVLDGVDIVVRRRRDGVGALGNHAGARHLLVDLLAGQMPPDAGLGALADLDLDGGAGVQVVRVHAEASAGHLHDGAVGVGFQIAVQAAFAAVEVGAQLARGHRERLLSVKRHRAEAHGREHDGHI